MMFSNKTWFPFQVELPNFILTDTIDMEAYLMAMDIQCVFDPKRCDMSNLADNALGMNLSIIRQSVKVKVLALIIFALSC